MHYQGSQQSGKTEIQVHVYKKENGGCDIFCLSDIPQVSFSSDDSFNDDYWLWLWLDWKEKSKDAVEETFCLDETSFPYSILVVCDESLLLPQKKKKEVFWFAFFAKEVVEASKDVEDLKNVEEALGMVQRLQSV